MDTTNVEFIQRLTLFAQNIIDHFTFLEGFNMFYDLLPCMYEHEHNSPYRLHP